MRGICMSLNQALALACESMFPRSMTRPSKIAKHSHSVPPLVSVSKRRLIPKRRRMDHEQEHEAIARDIAGPRPCICGSS